MTAPKPGERWRVTIDGIVRTSPGDGFLPARLEIEDHGVFTLPQPERAGVAWERLPDPEPAWKDGEVVRDAEDTVLVRDRGGWRFGREWNRDDFPVRPLVRLVPEGGAW